MDNGFDGRVVPLFLSPDETEFLLNSIKDIDKWNDEPAGTEFHNNTLQLDVLRALNPEAAALADEVQLRLQNYIMSEYKETNVYGSFYFAVRLPGPEHLSLPHRDAQPENIPGTEVLKYASIVYLNSDFTGGSLFYPDYDFHVYPKPGLLAIHPASYLHAIQPYEGAPRYTILSFWQVG